MMAMDAEEIIFSLHIPAQDYVHYYKGVAKYVVTKSRDGRTVKFPANILQKYLTHDGIHGEFLLRFDGNHKLISIEKIGAGR